jgi:hypothetical protein
VNEPRQAFYRKGPHVNEQVVALYMDLDGLTVEGATARVHERLGEVEDTQHRAKSPVPETAKMDALLASFVTKVSRHVTEDGADAGDAMKHLIPNLTPRSSTIVVEKILNALAHDPRRHRNTIRDAGGIRALISYMAANDPADVPMHIADRACTVLSKAGATSVTEALLHAESGTLQHVLSWYALAQSVFHALLFASALTTIELRNDFLTLDPVPTIISLLGEGADTAATAQLAARVLSNLVQGDAGKCAELLRSNLFATLAKFRIDGNIDPPHLLRAFATVLRGMPHDAAVALPGGNFIDALAEDINECDTEEFVDVLTILENDSACSSLFEHMPIAQTYFLKLIDLYGALSEMDRVSALQSATVAAIRQPFLPRVIFDSIFYTLNDDATRPLRALIFALGVPSDEIIPHLKRLLRDAGNCLELDEKLTHHFDFLVKHQELVLGELELEAGRCLLFHTIDDIVGREIPEGTHIAEKICAFLTNEVEHARVHCKTTPGLERYCREVEVRYNISTTPVGLPILDSSDRFSHFGRNILQRCPVYLEMYHLPVVASDGITYELEALIRLARMESFVSPISRAPLRMNLSVNKTLQDTEHEIVKETARGRFARRRHAQEVMQPREEKKVPDSGYVSS